MTSRQRLLRAWGLQEPDHIPCCFMSFSALRRRYKEDRYKVVLAQREMGFDAMLFIPTSSRQQRPEHPDLRGLPVRFSPDVETREWSAGDVLHKAYATPGGTVTTSVRPAADWPHGNHIPFVDDYQIPRLDKPLVTASDDLDALHHLLTAPTEADILHFEKEAETARAFSARHQVPLVAGWGVGLDLANWLCGMEELMVLNLEKPDFVRDLLEMIHVWNLKRMDVVLSASIDLFIRRAWYEGVDFVTPAVYRDAVLPRLRAEVDLTHERGTRFGLICSSGLLPLLDHFLEADIDVLIGIDPVQGTHTDMSIVKEKIGHRICLWGGVSGAVTVERSTAEEVRRSVRLAVRALGPTGFILSPVDNITVDAPRTWRNIEVFADEWRRHW
jgi:uroporphyrinogen-III decarboxylase